MPIPVTCSVNYGATGTASMFCWIAEKGNNALEIIKIEKWLLQNGYQKNGEKYYEKGNYWIKKSYYSKEDEMVLRVEYDCDTSWFGMFKDIYNRIFNPDLE